MEPLHCQRPQLVPNWRLFIPWPREEEAMIGFVEERSEGQRVASASSWDEAGLRRMIKQQINHCTSSSFPWPMHVGR